MSTQEEYFETELHNSKKKKLLSTKFSDLKFGDNKLILSLTACMHITSKWNYQHDLEIKLKLNNDNIILSQPIVALMYYACQRKSHI